MMLACAGLVAVVNFSMVRDQHALATRGQRTEAVIVRNELSGGHRPASPRPVFAFTTADGRDVEGAPRAWDSAGQLQPGQRVLVIYDTADATHAQGAESLDANGRPARWGFDLMALLFVTGAVVAVVRPQRS